MKKFKFLEHTADVKFQAFGSSVEEAFKNSALAMSKTILNKELKGDIIKKIKVKGKDNERLLYNFLEELLFLFDSENFLITDIKDIKIEGENLKAEVIGVNAENYEMENNVKSVTYNEMFVKKEKYKWVVQVVLDV